jgi:secondary thiamine-phosphate synthase enzyme
MACLLSERLTVATAAPFQCVAITSQLQELVERSGLDEGVLVAAGQHTTTALVVNENEQRLLADFEAFMRRLVPQQHPWLHNDLELRADIPPDEPRNAHSHLIALILGNHLTLPIQHGRLALGRYQDVLLVELDGPRQRKLLVQLRD